MSLKVHPGSYAASGTCNGEVDQPSDGKHDDYLHTFSTHTEGTVGDGNVNTAVFDGVKGLVIKNLNCLISEN